MIPWYSKLEWHSYSIINDYFKKSFTELDKFADYTFDNGISIRINTGRMALSKYSHPYELNILYPDGKLKIIPYLNRCDLRVEMEKLNNLNNEYK